MRTVRSVRLSADFGASPLWVPGPHGYCSVSLDRFDLSAGLRDLLGAWARTFDGLAETDYAWASPAAEEAWRREADALLVELRDELGAGYQVELVP